MKKLQELTLFDKFLFDETMDIPEAHEAVLQIIFGDDNLKLLTPAQTEKEIRTAPWLRSIRLDVYAMDFGRKKLPPVARKLLVVVLVAVIVGQCLDRVGQAHRLKGQLRVFRPHDGGVKDRGEEPAVVPIVVFHGKCSPWQNTLAPMLPQSYERKKNPYSHDHN